LVKNKTSNGRAVHFAGNWIYHQPVTRRMGKRILALLRRAHKVLGINRKRLGIGGLGGRTSRVPILTVTGEETPVTISQFVTIASPVHSANALILALVSTFSLVAIAPAFAQSVQLGGGTTTEPDGVAIGSGAQATDSTPGVTDSRPVAIGAGAVANSGSGGGSALAVGAVSNANGSGATAIGDQTDAIGNGATAIGGRGSSDGAIANGARAIAIGGGSGTAAAETGLFGANDQVFGAAASAIDAIAIGASSFANRSGSIAVGRDSTASGVSSLAIGVGAFTLQPNSIALGAGSRVNIQTAPSSVAIGGTTYLFNGSATADGALSIGATGLTRGIQYVAPGVLALTSTDAVNGSQLFATNTSLETLFGRVGTIETSAANSVVDVDTLGAATARNFGGGATWDAVNDTLSSPTYTIGGISYTDVGAAFTGLTGQVNTGRIGPVQRNGASDALTLVSNGGTSSAPGPLQLLLNLAPGRLNTGSTDAVNGAQLFATNTTLATIQTLANNLDAGTDGVLQRDAVSPIVYLTGPSGTFTTPGQPQVLRNLASGSIASGSLDAVNGGQLFNTNSILTTVQNLANNIDGRVTTITNTLANNDVGILRRNATQSDVFLTGIGGTGTNPGPASVLRNVAAGDVSAASTYAVNGAQLFATNTNVTSVTGRVAAAEGNITNINADVDTLGTGTASSLGGGATWDAVNDTLSSPTYTVAGTNYTNVGSALTGLAGLVNSVGLGQVQRLGTGNQLVLVGAGGTAAAPGAAQQLTNLAAATLGVTSTDAVTGAQLFATNTNVTNLGNIISNGTVGVLQRSSVPNRAVVTAANGTGANPGAAQQLGNIAAGALTATSSDAVNGAQLFATNTNVTSLGDRVTTVDNRVTTVEGDIANLGTDVDGLGAGTASSLGGGATWNPVTDSLSRPTYTIAGSSYNDVGSALTGLTTMVSNGGVGPVQRLGTTDQLVMVGAGGTAATPGAAQRVTNVAAATLGATSTDAVNGAQLFATNTNVTNLGDRVTTVDNRVTSVDNRVTTLGDTIANGTVGVLQRSSIPNRAVVTAANGTGANPGAAQQLGNIAAGALTATSSDAVNGAQLFATNTNVTSLGDRVTTVDNRVTTVEGDIANLGTDVDGLGAGTASSLGGGATWNPVTDSLSRPTYTIAGSSYNDVGSALTGLTTMVSNGGVGPVQRLGTTDQLVMVGAGGTAATPGAAQRVTNVAAATLGATSTDAVNGAQLFATNTNVTNLGDRVTTVDNRVTSVDNRVTTLGDTIANGTVGVLQRSSVPNRAVVTAANGTGANPGAAQQLGNVAEGTQLDDAVTLGQLNRAVASNAGNNAPIRSSYDGTSTTVASGGNSLAVGRSATATAANSTAIGEGATATLRDSVAIGANSTTSAATSVSEAIIGDASYAFAGSMPVGTLSVGSSGRERQIQNVGAGRISAQSTDAVNGSQLFATNLAINDLRFDLREVAKQAFAGTATAIALQPPAFIEAGQIAMRLGYGVYRGQSALGLSMRATADNGRWSFSGGVSGSKTAGVAGSVGLDFVLGR
jgi:trimeric autotransporter adhesin